MNERIESLMKQASGEFYEGFAGSPNSIKFMEEEFEKFAELIIQECQKCVNQYIHECGEVASLPDYVLNSHFGVEE
jgi:hypothetical protein